MGWMILWHAVDKPTLFESEEYDTEEEACDALTSFRAEYFWNTYWLVRVEDIAPATGENPTTPKITFVADERAD